MFERVQPDLSALVSAPLEELVFRFDQDFDLPLEHHVGIGLLETRGTLTPAGVLHDPVATVATYWMRMIQCDVRWDLLRGLEAVADSAGLVEGLRAEPMSKYTAYVLARWHDAAGRLQFRCGDMMAARMAFARAHALAKHPALWYCRPDLESNLLRATFDEREKAGADHSLAVEARGFDDLLKRSMVTAERHYIRLNLDQLQSRLEQALIQVTPVPAGEDLLAGMLGDGVSPGEQREFLRGLANVLHNTSVVHKPEPRRSWDGNPDYAIKTARQSAALAFGLRDEVRLAQALRNGATLSQAAPASRERALVWLRAVEQRLNWQRGRWMATQAIARMEPSLAAVDRLEAILSDLDKRRAVRGEEAGFDVDLYRYTLDALEYVCASIDPGGEVQQHIQDRRLANAASVRRVVKVAVYRARFAQLIFPLYMSQIERARADVEPEQGDIEALEELFTRVEEVNARDLLDTLADQTRSGGAPAVYEYEESGEPVTALRGDGVRSLPRSSFGLTDARAAIEFARQRFEEVALLRPMTVTPSDPEIAGAVRRLTAAQPGLVVVRYFVYGWGATRVEQTAGPLHLGALVFRSGRIELVDLHADIAALAHRSSGQPPTQALAELLWSQLIEPVWSRLEDPDDIEHLTLIPASGMFSLPLHSASRPGTDLRPLCARVPLSFSVSATAYVTHRRYLLRVQPRDPDDDLCALVPEIGAPAGEGSSTSVKQLDIYPGELEAVDWNAPRFHLAGARPEGLDRAHFRYCGRGNRAGLDRLLSTRAELFVFAGHGLTMPVEGDVEVALQLADGEFLTQYDLATDLRMRRNKWTILGACVSGQGGDTASGEVAGFVRSFIAAGAGALAVSLWPVADAMMATVVGELLKQISASHERAFDIVTALHRIQAEQFTLASERLLTPQPPRNYNLPRCSDEGPAPGLLGCPLALYL